MSPLYPECWLSITCLLDYSSFPSLEQCLTCNCWSINFFLMNAKRLNQMRMGVFLLDLAICHLLVSLMSSLSGALRVRVKAK